ncbi:MAG: DUF6655 family protein [Planctomycetia bacterium]
MPNPYPSFRTVSVAVGSVVALAVVGCGTTRMTDTSRSATEMLLVSHSIEESVGRIDFSPLAGKAVYFDEKPLDGVTDKGYVASCLRQHLLAAGCQLVEEKPKAIYVVEARAGCVATDKSSFLIGVPAMTLPAIVPGQPPAIPEIPLIKSSDQKGVARLAVFAYNRATGRAVWQSGTHESTSNTKESWVFGTGPFRRGTVKPQTDGVLGELDVLDLAGNPAVPAQSAVTQAAVWTEDPAAPGLNGPTAAEPEGKIQPAAATTAPTTPEPFPESLKESAAP